MESHWFIQITLLKHLWQQSLVILVTPWFFFNNFSFSFSEWHVLYITTSRNCELQFKGRVKTTMVTYKCLNKNFCTIGWHYLDVTWVTIFCSIREANRYHAIISFISASLFKRNQAFGLQKFPNKTGPYPLFSCMVPSLEKQNQLLPHDLVTKKKQHLFNEQSHYAFLRQIIATIKAFLCCFSSVGISFQSITSAEQL